VNVAATYPPPEDDWWRVGPGKGMCKKCGEERMVHQVVDFRGIQHFCQVCAHAWWVIGKDRNWRD
jgi:hypothetical protein